jgi:hypothetical protein
VAYCSSDGKFASFDEMTVEVEDSDVTDDTFTMTVRAVRPCASCGNEQAEYTFDFDQTIEHSCPDERGEEGAHAEDFEEDLEDRTFELRGEPDVEVVDDYQTTDRHGKPIKSVRYQRHLLGVSYTATVTCSRCEDEIELTDSETVPASSFDDQGSH